jgi:hypothetical protein
MKDKLGNNIPAKINGKDNPEYNKIRRLNPTYKEQANKRAKDYYSKNLEYVKIRNKEYYKINKEKCKKKMKKYRDAHKEEHIKYNKDWYQTHKEQQKENSKKWGENNKEQRKKLNKKSYENMKKQRDKIIILLGNKCNNPYNINHSAFEKDIDYNSCLQIDHINGGGRKQHKKLGSNSTRFYKYILTHLSEFQLLCANCNWLKRKKNGEYIHK